MMSYKRLLVLADLAQALLLGSIPVLAILGVLRLWQLYVVVVLAGVASLFEMLTAQSFIPRLVSRQQLLPANSTLMLSNATVGTTGSALGGALVALLTAPVAVATDAVSFLAAGLCKARIQAPGLSVVPAGRDKGTAPITARLGPGRAFIAGMLLASTAGVVLAGAFRPLPRGTSPC